VTGLGIGIGLGLTALQGDDGPMAPLIELESASGSIELESAAGSIELEDGP
jgi:hypothetical protein